MTTQKKLRGINVSGFEASHILIILLLVANLFFSVYSLNQKAVHKTDSALALEIMKVGGPENFELVKQLYNTQAYKEQQKEAISSVLEQFSSMPTPDTAVQPTPTPDVAVEPTTEPAPMPTPSTDPVAVNTTMINQVKTIKEDGYIKGNPNARFTIVEYSDIECPFCKRHHQAGTLNRVLQAYPNDVNIVFRHFPLNFHPNAQKAGEGAECAGELAGVDAFYAFIDAAFAGNDLTQTSLIAAARTAGLDETAFTTCLTSGKYATKVIAQQTEGSSLFGVNGTPGNVLIDNETGRHVVIAGAYPFEKFDEEIKNMLK